LVSFRRYRYFLLTIVACVTDENDETMLKRHRDPSNDTVSSADRLGDYVVTQTPGGSRPTGLPAPHQHGEDARPGEREATVRGMPVGMHFVEERRGDPRLPAKLHVYTTHPGNNTGIDGETFDVSLGGMCLDMPAPPPTAHQDVLVEDADRCSTVWVQVLDYEQLSTGVYRWHVRVTAGDDEWEQLIAALSNPSATDAETVRPRRVLQARTA
jgi:hypothetical protein